MNILIVEDSAAVRRMIRSVVQSFVNEIHECTDGAEALAAYEQYHPDWVLMDIEMQLVDGLEATRRLQTKDPRSKICIVTGYDDADLREAATRAGAAAYLVKDDLHLLKTFLTGPCEPQNSEQNQKTRG